MEHYSSTQKISKKDTGKEEDVWASHGLHKHHKLGFYSKHLLLYGYSFWIKNDSMVRTHISIWYYKFYTAATDIFFLLCAPLHNNII